jgi:hypothetical protein
MRTLVGFGLSLLLAAGLFAQYRGGFASSRPFAQGAFGNAVFPGGRPQFIVPGAVTDPTFAMRLGATVAPPGLWRRPSVPGTRRPGMVFVYGYPVYVGGYFDNAYPADAAAPPPQQPNITAINPPQPAPEMIQRFDSDAAQDPTTPTAAADPQPVEEPASTFEPSHYLIAFKDHSVYSAVAYWVDGDTLHYFTSGNTHNQASVSLVDRDLTERLNKESGIEVKIP